MSTTQQRLNEIAEQEKKLADEKAKLLEASKDADLKAGGTSFLVGVGMNF